MTRETPTYRATKMSRPPLRLNLLWTCAGEASKRFDGTGPNKVLKNPKFEKKKKKHHKEEKKPGKTSEKFSFDKSSFENAGKASNRCGDIPFLFSAKSWTQHPAPKNGKREVQEFRVPSTEILKK